MNRLHESLYILHKCSANIRLVWEAIEAHKQHGPVYRTQHFTHNLLYYIILESVSYLGEYNEHFLPNNVEDEFMQRVFEVKRINKPIHKRIDRWKSLGQFRNNIIAHPWRAGGRFVLPQNIQYNIPRSWLEYQLLKDLVSYSYAIVQAEFGKEVDAARVLAEQLKHNVKPKLDYDEVNQDISKMVKELKQLSLDLDKDYNVSFFWYP